MFINYKLKYWSGRARSSNPNSPCQRVCEERSAIYTLVSLEFSNFSTFCLATSAVGVNIDYAWN